MPDFENTQTTATTQTTTAGATTPPPNQTQPGGATTQQQSHVPSFLETTPFIGSASGNSSLLRVSEVLRKWLADNNNQVMEVLPIDAASVGLGISAVALVYPWTSATQGKEIYIAYLMLFEETLQDYSTEKTRDIGGTVVHLTTTTDDYVSAGVLKRFETTIASRAKNRGREVKAIGFKIINRLTSARPDETNAYISIASEAGEAMANYIEYGLNEKARVKATVRSLIQNRTLNMSIDTSGVQALNSQGQPIRNDLTLTVVARENVAAQNGVAVQFEAPAIPLTTTHGYLDITYIEKSAVERMNAGMGGLDPAAQFRDFVVTPIISEIQNQRGVWDVDSIVNAILSMYNLIPDRKVFTLLMKKFSNSSAARLRDVGSLPMESGTEGYFDLNAANVNPMNFFNVFFKQTFNIGIDLPRQSAYGFFRQILRGSVEQGSNSYQALVRALNEYTDGHFPITYSGPILTLTPRPVLLGHYNGSSHGLGVSVHDIRDWEDYLTFLTQLGATDIHAVREFDAALAGTNGRSLEERTTYIYNKLAGIVSNVTLTGKADRYIFAPGFVETLVNAAAAASLHIRSSQFDIGGAVTSNRQSLTGAFSQGIQTQNLSNIFSSTSGGNGASGGVGGGINLFGM